MDNELYVKALAFANEKHAGQNPENAGNGFVHSEIPSFSFQKTREKGAPPASRGRRRKWDYSMDTLVLLGRSFLPSFGTLRRRMPSSKRALICSGSMPLPT